MKIEICGKGYLGTYAYNYFSRHLGRETIFSEKSFQFGEKNYLENNSQSEFFLNVCGPSSVDESVKIPHYYLEEPLKQVQFQISELSKLANPPNYIFMSSASVYGSRIGSTATEEDSLSPLSPYASGKIAAEKYLYEISGQYKGRITVIRATSIFSKELNSRVLGRIRSQLQKGENFELYGTGSEVRDFIYAGEFFQILDAIITHSEYQPGFKVYNLGSGKPITIMRLLQIALESTPKLRAGLKVKFNHQVRQYDPHSITVSIEKLKHELGLIPSSPEKYLKKYFSVEQI